MHTATEATQAIISPIRRDCFGHRYFPAKASDYILSEVRLRVSGGAICPQLGFWEGE